MIPFPYILIIPAIWGLVLLVKYQIRKIYYKGYIKGIEDAQEIVINETNKHEKL